MGRYASGRKHFYHEVNDEVCRVMSETRFVQHIFDWDSKAAGNSVEQIPFSAQNFCWQLAWCYAVRVFLHHDALRKLIDQLVQTFHIVSEKIGGRTFELSYGGTQSEHMIKRLSQRVKKALHVFSRWTHVLNYKIESLDKLFTELVELFKL